MSRRARRYAEATAAKRGDFMAQDLSPGLTAWLAAQPDARLIGPQHAAGHVPPDAHAGHLLRNVRRWAAGWREQVAGAPLMAQRMHRAVAVRNWRTYAKCYGVT